MIKKYIKRWIRCLCTIRAKRQVKAYGEDFRVNFPCKFTSTTTIGSHCSFNGITVTNSQNGGELIIGDYFHSGKDVRIILDIHNYEGGKIPYDETIVKKSVKIDDFVWVGTGVTILGGVHIGEGAIIQACSTVVSDIPACAIAGGHPARVFKYRDKEHYYKLKEEGQFF